MAMQRMEGEQTSLADHRRTEYLAERLAGAAALALVVAECEGALEPGMRSAEVLLRIEELLRKAQEVDGLIGLRAPSVLRRHHYDYQIRVVAVVRTWLRATKPVLPLDRRLAFFERFHDDLRDAGVETLEHAESRNR